jgi:hypothetical protein
MCVNEAASGTKEDVFQLLTGGIEEAVANARQGEIIAIRATSILGADLVRANLDSDVLASLTTKNAQLAIQTGDVAIQFPANSIDLDAAATRLGTSQGERKLN